MQIDWATVWYINPKNLEYYFTIIFRKIWPIFDPSTPLENANVFSGWSLKNIKVNLLNAGSVYNRKSLFCFVNWTRQITIFSSIAISAFLPNVSISNQLNYFSFWKTFGFDQLNYFSYFRFGEIITFWKNPLNSITYYFFSQRSLERNIKFPSPSWTIWKTQHVFLNKMG